MTGILSTCTSLLIAFLQFALVVRDMDDKYVYRQSGLGKDGLIFRFTDESIYFYWDTAGLPGSNEANTNTAPYSTTKFDATTPVDLLDAGACSKRK